MGTFGTKLRLLLLAGCLSFVPFCSAADVTKGEFKGAIDGKSVESKKSGKKEESSAPKRKTYPFHGNLSSVDASKNILVMEGKKRRTIRVDSSTKFTRNDAPAALADGKPGERVTGSVTRDEQGAELAVSVKFAGGTRTEEGADSGKKRDK